MVLIINKDLIMFDACRPGRPLGGALIRLNARPDETGPRRIAPGPGSGRKDGRLSFRP